MVGAARAGCRPGKASCAGASSVCIHLARSPNKTLTVAVRRGGEEAWLATMALGQNEHRSVCCVEKTARPIRNYPAPGLSAMHCSACCADACCRRGSVWHGMPLWPTKRSGSSATHHSFSHPASVVLCPRVLPPTPSPAHPAKDRWPATQSAPACTSSCASSRPARPCVLPSPGCRPTKCDMVATLRR